MTYEAGQAWSDYQREQREQQERNTEVAAAAQELSDLGKASVSRAMALQERIGVDEQRTRDMEIALQKSSKYFAIGPLGNSDNTQGYAVVEVAWHQNPVSRSVEQRRLFGLIRYSTLEHAWEPGSEPFSIALKFYAHRPGKDELEFYDGSSWIVGSFGEDAAVQLERMQDQLAFLEGMVGVAKLDKAEA